MGGKVFLWVRWFIGSAPKSEVDLYNGDVAVEQNLTHGRRTFAAERGDRKPTIRNRSVHWLLRSATHQLFSWGTTMFAKGMNPLVLLTACLIAQDVIANDYDVTVTVDEATVSEAKMLGMLLKETPSDVTVPRSMRALAMQVAGEVETAFLKQKTDDDAGVLLLDSGAPVLPIEEDSILASLKDPLGNGAEVTIGFSSFRTPSGQLQTRACAATVLTPTGECVGTRIPPVSVERGPFGKQPKPTPTRCNMRCKLPL